MARSAKPQFRGSNPLRASLFPSYQSITHLQALKIKKAYNLLLPMKKILSVIGVVFALILVIWGGLYLMGGSFLRETGPIRFKYEHTCPAGATVLESLTANYDGVLTQDTSFGKMVTAVRGTNQGFNKYWLYTVNDQEATISADAYRCVGGEKVKWELK